MKTANANSSEHLNKIIQVGSNQDSECIGISDGGFPFDTSMLQGDERPGNYATIKWQALEKLNAGDLDGAYSLWNKAGVTNDAEMLIYFQNQLVLTSHNPYINIVVGTMLTGEYVRTGRDIIQGVYVAQKENNDNMPGYCIFVDPTSRNA